MKLTYNETADALDSIQKLEEVGVKSVDIKGDDYVEPKRFYSLKNLPAINMNDIDFTKYSGEVRCKLLFKDNIIV